MVLFQNAEAAQRAIGTQQSVTPTYLSFPPTCPLLAGPAASVAWRCQGFVHLSMPRSLCVSTRWASPARLSCASPTHTLRGSLRACAAKLNNVEMGGRSMFVRVDKFNPTGAAQ